MTKKRILSIIEILCAFAYISYPVLISYTSLNADSETQGTVLGLVGGSSQLLFAFVPSIIYILNKSFGVNFGNVYSKNQIILAPSYLIVAIVSLLALPLLLKMSPITEL